MYKAKHLPKFHLPPISRQLIRRLNSSSPLFHSHPEFFKKPHSPKIQILQ